MDPFGNSRSSTGPTLPFFGMFPFLAPAARPALGKRKGTVLAVCSRKGGVGKTTTSVNLAASLSRMDGVKVLLLDVDPQGHAGSCVPLKDPNEKKRNLDDLILESRPDLGQGVRLTKVDDLSVVLTGPRLGESERILSARIGKEMVLRSALEVPRTHYDYVVVDCPPSLSTLAVASLAACNAVIIPCELSPIAIRGLEHLVRALAEVHQRLNSDLHMLGMVVNRVDMRNTRLNTDAWAELERLAGGLLFKTWIRTSTALPLSQAEGVPITLYDGRSPVAEDYLNLAQEVMDRTRAL